MESAQRELVSVLLGRLVDRGLLSKTTYLGAADLVHSVIDLPEFFHYPVCLAKEECQGEHTENTQ